MSGRGAIEEWTIKELSALWGEGIFLVMIFDVHDRTDPSLAALCRDEEKPGPASGWKRSIRLQDP